MSQTLLVELLTEELPARGLRDLGMRFGRAVADALIKAGYASSDAVLQTYATPRRLAFTLAQVSRVQPQQTIERKGPALSATWKDGQPTAALIGFARSCGVPIEQLERSGVGRAEVMVYRATRAGETLESVLPGLLEQSLRALPAHKLMRWGSGDTEFIRPVHRLVILLGDQVLEAAVMGLPSGRTSSGHRFLGAAELTINDADHYAAQLATTGRVLADFASRAAAIEQDLDQAAGSATLADRGLIEEVAALVEYPAIYQGYFDQAFLAVPQECLMLTMKANQKYFPLLDADGRLLNRFLIVSNMPIDDAAAIVRGNERVLRARLSDARFFFDQDRRERLDARVEALAQVVYHNRLGSQRERTERIVQIACAIAQALPAVSVPEVARAALLCKADLLTGMVGEFPELQGIMGMHYARHDGEPETVCRAIEAHYRPRGAGAALPEDATGDCVALADKLDTLAGIYGIGLIPTGDKDPFGLRRAALGVVRILIEHRLTLNLDELVTLACAQLTHRNVSATLATDLVAFITERLRSYLRDSGNPAEDIDAVLSLAPTRLDTIPDRLAALQAFRHLPESAALAAANKRISNILRKSAVTATTQIDTALLLERAEQALYEQLLRLEPQIDQDLQRGQFAEALLQLASLRDPVDVFFDQVMVNADQAALRTNRLALMTRLSALMSGVADLSRLSA